MPHDHQNGAAHEALVVEDDTGNLEGQIIVDALQQVLVSKGLLAHSEVAQQIAKLEAPGTHLGARIIAKAWTEPTFKQRLFENAKDAIIDMGLAVGEAQLIVVENTATTHNLITCTLCSCYPRSILGQPPSWYISKAYRARAVREPRSVLAEFGLDLSDDIDLLVHDSNADMRYLVLPEPPQDHTAMTAKDLEPYVTRDHMIGVARDCSVPRI